MGNGGSKVMRGMMEAQVSMNVPIKGISLWWKNGSRVRKKGIWGKEVGE